MAGEVIRRKVAAGRREGAEAAQGADRVWRLALARAANDLIALPLEVARLSAARRTLAELLDQAPERALIAVLEGPGDGLGILALSAPVLSAMIEMQTMGRVGPAPPPARKPTRTDATMVAGVIDRALEDLEAGLDTDPDITWAGGFRYASFLDDPRPLGLLLEEESYRVLLAEVRLAGGAKTGEVLLALPAEGRGRAPRPMPEATPEPVAQAQFARALTEQVMLTEAELAAVLHRMTVPLSQVMGLAPGAILPLPMAALERIVLQGLDGRQLAVGKLGQNRGMRAVRLTPEPATEAAAPGGAAAPPVLRVVGG